ncbi:MAG: beta-glucuronidase, partial [Bacteroidetes bacterium]
MRQFILWTILALALSRSGQAQASQPLLHNVFNREAVSLNGNWHYIIDPYETGYRNHRRWEPFDEYENKKASAAPYWLNRKKGGPSERIEYDFARSPTLAVPGDWNHQDDKLLYYEGTVWYERDFEFEPQPNQRYFLYFGAVNYRADVYLNGQKVGFHEGPFDPFNFEITKLLRSGTNEVVVRADNRRSADRVPGLTTDWWNFGGITRTVKIVVVPNTFIQDYHLQLDVKDPTLASGYVQVAGATGAQQVRLRIPEINYETTLQTDAKGYAEV